MRKSGKACEKHAKIMRKSCENMGKYGEIWGIFVGGFGGWNELQFNKNQSMLLSKY
jgi:hypothetical protein